MFRLKRVLFLAMILIVLITLTVTVGFSNDETMPDEFVPLDATTGLPLVENEHPFLAPILEAKGRGVNILWDTHHGVFTDYRPKGRYSGWRDLLQAKGHLIDENDQGILSHELVGYDVLVINLASAWHSPYSLKEVSFIVDFVSGGGSLLILGDHSGTPNDHINLVSLAFGTNLGVNFPANLDVYFRMFAEHAVFQNIEELYFRAAGGIRVNPPSLEMAWTNNLEVMMAAAEYGRGRVFMTGDVNFMDNTYVVNADNQRFVENLFDWLIAGVTRNP